MPRRSVALLFLLLAFAGCRPDQTSDNVWSGIVMANNVPEPTPIPAELTAFQGTLKQLLGYNQFRVIGESRNALKGAGDDWSAKSKYFSLHVDSKGAQRDSYLLNLQLFQQEKLLLETEAKLSKSSPLVIKGPQVGDGQLVLLLVMQ